MKMNAGRCAQVAGRKKITTQLINRVVIIFFMVEIRRRFVCFFVKLVILYMYPLFPNNVL